MPSEKKLTLLTPAILHCSALEYLVREGRSYHQKYVLRFGLMQGLWALLFFLVLTVNGIFPWLGGLRSMGAHVLTNAHFSSCSIDHGKLSIDIKPSIWSYTVADSPTYQQNIVIAPSGALNRFYWDDRVEGGVVKKVDGIGFLGDHVFIKRGTNIKTIPYNKIMGNARLEMTKTEMFERFTTATEPKKVLLAVLLLAPVIFVLGMLAGMLAHVVFIVVTGIALRLMSFAMPHRSSAPYKISSGLYVAFAYVVALTVAVQLLFLNAVYLLWLVKIFAYLAVLGIGHHCLRTMKPARASVPPTKSMRGSW